MVKRAKKPKKPENKTVQLSYREYLALKRECYHDATDRTMLLLLVAAKDELAMAKYEPEKITELLAGIAKRTEHYADVINKKILELQDMQEDLQEWLGRNVTGYSNQE